MKLTIEQTLAQGVASHNKGKLQEAEQFYRAVLQAQSAHPNSTHTPGVLEAHFNLGITLQQQARLEEAEESYRQAIALKADFAEAHGNLGNTLRELGRLEEAEESYRQAIALKANYAEAYNNLAVTLQERGKFDEAETRYKQAISLKTDYAEAHYNLGNMLRERGRLNEAEACCQKAIALKPEYAEAHNNLGVTLQELGRLAEAEASYKLAIAVKPNYAEAQYNLGFLFYSAKEYGKALEQFKSINFGKSKHYLLRCLYEQGEQTPFFDHLDVLINQGEVHPMIGSLGYRSQLKYGVERPNLFCKDPLNYVYKTDLKNQYDFDEVFIKTIRTVLNENRIPGRRQGLLVNGYQSSGNLFQLEREFTEEIQTIIRLEIEKYRTLHKESKEGLITHWPAEYDLLGWLIALKSGGELGAHIHETGWISGTVYINVPPKLKPDSGNLVVAFGDEKDTTNTHRNTKKSVDVTTGNLVLFPASLTHYTVPFESEEERICIAFDVIPK